MFHFLRILTALVLAFFFSGCGDNGADDGKIVLRFWHIMNYSGPREVLEGAVRRFEQAHSGVKVEVEMFSNDDYKTKLALEMASGNEPDVFFNWGAGGQTGQFIAKGRLADLTAWAAEHRWEERFMASAMELCRKDGNVYCAPLDMSAVVLWCNGRIFREQGLAYPKTWTDFQNVCTKLKSRGVTPLALGNYNAWPGDFYYCYLANRLGGTQLFRDAASGANGASFEDKAFIDAGTMLQALVNDGVFNVDYAERREDEARKLFVLGRSAMYLGGSWLVGQIVKDPACQEFLKDLTAQPFPVLPEGRGEPDTLLGGINCGFSIAEKCTHKELAMELVETLVDDVTCKEWCTIGRIPACKVGEEWTVACPEATKGVLKLMKGARELQPYYDQQLAADVSVVHTNTTKDLFSGRTTPEAAAKAVAQRQKQSR